MRGNIDRQIDVIPIKINYIIVTKIREIIIPIKINYIIL